MIQGGRCKQFQKEDNPVKGGIFLTGYVPLRQRIDLLGLISLKNLLTLDKDLRTIIFNFKDRGHSHKKSSKHRPKSIQKLGIALYKGYRT
jgi:hypothetical protein